MIAISIIVYIVLNRTKPQKSHFNIEPPLEIKVLIYFIIFAVLLSAIISGLQPDSIWALFRTIIFFFICYMLFIFFDSFELYKLFFSSIIISAILIALSIYYEMFNTGFTMYVVQGVLARYSGIYGNPNYAGSLLAISLIILIAGFFFTDWYNRTLRIVAVFITFFNGFALMITNSRSAIIGILLALLFIFYQVNKKKFLKILLILFFLFLLVLFIPSINEYWNFFIRLQTVEERSFHWQVGWEIMTRNLPFGIGPELYPLKVFSYTPSDAINFYLVDTSIFKFHPHNYFLLMIGENGINGAIFSIAIFFVFFKLSLVSIAKYKTLDLTKLLVSVICCAVGILIFIRAFFEVDGVFSYGYITRDIPFWLFFIIISRLNLNQTRKNCI
jgi:O-antigen ligase